MPDHLESHLEIYAVFGKPLPSRSCHGDLANFCDQADSENRSAKDREAPFTSKSKHSCHMVSDGFTGSPVPILTAQVGVKPCDLVRCAKCLICRRNADANRSG